MANAEDLDIAIDGFDPDVLNPRNRRHRQDSVALDPIMPLNPRSDTRNKKKTPPAPSPAVTEEKSEPAEERVRPQETEEGKWWDRMAIVSFFKKDGTRLFLGLFLIILSVFILIAFMSHLKYGAQDQSLVLNSTMSEMAAHPEAVHNAGGSFGAWLSQALLCDSLGLGSLTFIVYAWLLALGLLGLKKCNFWSCTFKTLLVSITTSIVLGLVFYNSDTALRWGGLHGHYVNEFLFDYATWIGASMVSALLLLAVVCVYLTEITNAWKKWRESVNRRKVQEQLRRERKRELENAIDANAEEPVRNVEETHDAPETAQASAQENIFASSTFVDETVVEKKNEPVVEKRNEPLGFTIEEAIEADDYAEKEPEAKPKVGFTINKVSDIPLIKIDEPESPSEPEGITIDLGGEIEPAAEEPELAEPKLTIEEPESAEEPVSAVDQVSLTVETNDIEEAKKIEKKPVGYNHLDEFRGYLLPKVDLLLERNCKIEIDMDEQEANKERIVKTLLNYNIPIKSIEATVGPTITLYEIVPADGVRISQIQRLENDIALSLSALGIRIIAPIPGQGTVGIEVPNKDPQTVSMRSVIASQKFQEAKGKMNLPMAMGATISNNIFMADLTKMPHLLVAGATGMGKSVGLNAILASLLYSKHPSELKLVLVDPKMLEFSLYAKIENYFLAKLPGEDEAIVTNMEKVIPTLNSLCIEMDNRYELMKEASVRTIEDYNQKFTKGLISPEDGHKYLPYIVVVVDEFADLIMQSGKEVERPIARIAQKARAAGIHMILATQRPSTNVITGLIKANFPGRIAFRVIQMVDSRTILDCPGANQLIGKGDMLFSHNGKMTRVQCAFIDTPEVEAIVDSIYRQVGPNMTYMLPEPEMAGGGEDGGRAGANIGDRDPLFEEVARFIISRNMGSTSSIQRQFNIGYNRAGRLMDQMEAAGIVGPVNGAKPRDIRMDMASLEMMLEAM